MSPATCRESRSRPQRRWQRFIGRSRKAKSTPTTSRAPPPAVDSSWPRRERRLRAPRWIPMPGARNGWSRVFLGRWIGSRRSREQEGDAPDPQATWQRSGNFRRLVLVGLTLAQTYVATNFMVAVMPYHGRQPLEVAMLVVFAILFAWVSGGFWTAMAGYVLLSLGGDRH